MLRQYPPRNAPSGVRTNWGTGFIVPPSSAGIQCILRRTEDEHHNDGIHTHTPGLKTNHYFYVRGNPAKNLPISAIALQTPAKAETEVVVAGAGRIPATIRHAGVRRVVAPAPTTIHPVAVIERWYKPHRTLKQGRKPRNE